MLYFEDVSVSGQLLDGKGGVSWLNDGVGEFWGWEDGESAPENV